MDIILFRIIHQSICERITMVSHNHSCPSLPPRAQSNTVVRSVNSKFPRSLRDRNLHTTKRTSRGRSWRKLVITYICKPDYNFQVFSISTNTSRGINTLLGKHIDALLQTGSSCPTGIIFFSRLKGFGIPYQKSLCARLNMKY